MPTVGGKEIPKKVAGIPTPVLVVGGVAAVAFLWMRSRSAQDAPTAAKAQRGKRGPAGQRGRRGQRGRKGPPGKKMPGNPHPSPYMLDEAPAEAGTLAAPELDTRVVVLARPQPLRIAPTVYAEDVVNQRGRKGRSQVAADAPVPTVTRYSGDLPRPHRRSVGTGGGPTEAHTRARYLLHLEGP